MSSKRDGCLSYISTQNRVMAKHRRKLRKKDIYEEKLSEVTIKSVIFQPSTNKTKTCEQVLKIMEKTMKSLKVACDLKNNITNIKKFSDNPQLHKLLNTYEKMFSFLTIKNESGGNNGKKKRNKGFKVQLDENYLKLFKSEFGSSKNKNTKTFEEKEFNNLVSLKNFIRYESFHTKNIYIMQKGIDEDVQKISRLQYFKKDTLVDMDTLRKS